MDTFYGFYRKKDSLHIHGIIAFRTYKLNGSVSPPRRKAFRCPPYLQGDMKTAAWKPQAAVLHFMMFS